MKERTKLEKIFTTLAVIFAILFIFPILLDNFGIINTDIMIQGFILSFTLVSIGIASFKSSRLLGIICFIVSIFIIIEAIRSYRFYNPFIWYKF